MNAQERLEIYKQMLVDFSLESPEERDEVNADCGFCYYADVTLKLYNIGDAKQNLPEIFEQEPKTAFDVIGHWFPTMYFDRVVGPDLNRMEVIEKAIEAVKAKL
jgi:hypothetical protein